MNTRNMKEIRTETSPRMAPCGVHQRVWGAAWQPLPGSAKDTTLRQTVYIKVWTAYIRPHYKARPDLASIGLDSPGFI